MKFIFILFIILIFRFNIYSQKNSFSKIDSLVEYNGSICNSFEEQSKKLIQTNWSEIEKIRAVYYWIAINIRYDSIGYKNGLWNKYKSDYSIANDTYNFKKGVCSGYSYLFKLMCLELGIESEVIDGYSRSEYYEAGFPINIENHSWNVVKINKEWFLIDLTWARISAKNKKVNDYYFLTPSNEFISNHFPLEDDWQLTDPSITKEDFDHFPYISAQYFELGLNNDFPKNGILYSNNNKIKLTLYYSNKYSFLLKLYDYKLDKWIEPNYTMNNTKDILDFTITLGKGKYLLRIDALENNSEMFKLEKGILYYNLQN